MVQVIYLQKIYNRSYSTSALFPRFARTNIPCQPYWGTKTQANIRRFTMNLTNLGRNPLRTTDKQHPYIILIILYSINIPDYHLFLHYRCPPTFLITSLKTKPKSVYLANNTTAYGCNCCNRRTFQNNSATTLAPVPTALERDSRRDVYLGHDVYSRILGMSVTELQKCSTDKNKPISIM